MRKDIYLILLLFVLCQGVALAQAQRHEIYVAYGLSPKGAQSKPVFAPVKKDQLQYSLSDEKMSGTISVGYAYCMSSRFSLGLSYTYSTYDTQVVLGSSNPLADVKTTNHLFLINTKFEWLKIKSFSLYTRGGIGVKYCNKLTYENVNAMYTPDERKAEKFLAWQISVLGAEWRFIPHLALFVEGGAGMQGCLLAGLRTHF